MTLETWLIFTLVPAATAAAAVRLEQDGFGSTEALRKSSGFALRALVVSMPFATLSFAFGASWRQALVVWDIGATSVLFSITGFFQLKRSFAGYPPFAPFAWLVIDILCVIGFFAIGYMLVAFEGGKTEPLMPDALYLSAMTLTTVGFGDITPVAAARPLAMLEALLGYAMLGAWAATLFHYVSSKETSKREASALPPEKGPDG